MSAPSLASAFAIGIAALNTSQDDTTGTYLVQTGNVGDGTKESDRAEWWQTPGFCSLPPNPTENQAAELFVYRRGSNDVILASRDQRGARKINPGETIIYASGADGKGQAQVYCDANGAVTVSTTTDNTASGQPISCKLDASGVKLSTPGGSVMLATSGAVTVSGQIAMGAAPLPLATGPASDAIAGALATFFTGFAAAATDPTLSASLNVFLGAVGPLATAAAGTITGSIPTLQTTTTTAT